MDVNGEGEALAPHATHGYDEMEEARAIALERLGEISARVEQATQHAETNATLLRLETDLQVIEALAAVAAKQVLRVIEAAGLLREAAYHEPRRDEVADQREAHQDDEQRG